MTIIIVFIRNVTYVCVLFKIGTANTNYVINERTSGLHPVLQEFKIHNTPYVNNIFA